MSTLEYLKIKRLFDVAFSLILIALLLPIWAVISIVILLDSGRPILFKQQRVGRALEKFNIYKFRTMKTSAPHSVPTHLLASPEKLITRSGKLLRKFSLDEIPQLVNILKGEMSFVGPRPALFIQEELIMLRQKFQANDILPGLTGWAQINGRDEVSSEFKAEYDGFYKKNVSFLLDFKIIIFTFQKVILSSGYKEGEFKNSASNNQ
ncbi:sugar transferase [Cohnella sp. GCM10020058]|uniref:sugar transferase n=1 Tax=Cohnella sp. GCM10020058 TaxID=3317330 RepID=UPI003637F4D6